MQGWIQDFQRGGGLTVHDHGKGGGGEGGAERGGCVASPAQSKEAFAIYVCSYKIMYFVPENINCISWHFG